MTTENSAPRIALYKDLLGTPIKENGETMLNISTLLKNVICEYRTDDMIPYVGKNLWVRVTVADKLQRVANALHTLLPGFKLKVEYGYRHPDIQRSRFELRKKQVMATEQGLSIEEIEEKANTMTANPITAGHPTGGAVDVTICDTNGNELDMGTHISDFSDPEKIRTYYSGLTPLQSENRKILHDLMVAEEFAPYYGEWWHFSYGDREWAWFYKKPNALYDQKHFHC